MHAINQQKAAQDGIEADSDSVGSDPSTSMPSLSVLLRTKTENNENSTETDQKTRKKKERIYPQIPIARNGVHTTSLSVLIQSLASAAANFILSYQDAVGNPDKSEEQKNDIISREMRSLFELQEQFIKLYILVKFVTIVNYGELVALRQELAQVQELSYCFQYAADSLIFVSDLAKKMRETHWNIGVASHILIEGKFEMLPKCLEADSYGLDNELTMNSTDAMDIDEADQKPKSVLFISQLEREKHDMKKLVHDHLLLYLLGTKVPSQMIIDDIKEGVVTVSVPGEFRAKLTLATRKKLKMPQDADDTVSSIQNSDYCLQIVKFRLLTNQSDILVSPVDGTTTNRLAALIQSRITNQLHPHPLVDMYDTVHRVALRLAIDILYQQALQLAKGRFSNLISVDHKYDEHSSNLSIIVGYWLGAPSMKSLEHVVEGISQNSDFQNRFSFVQFSKDGYKSDVSFSSEYQPSGQITVFIDTANGCLCIEHQPCELQCSIVLGNFLTEQSADLSNLNFSGILMKCLSMHSQERLFTLKKYIERETEFTCRLTEGSLLVSLFEQYELNIFINWKTGKFQFEILFGEQLLFPEDIDSRSLVYNSEGDALLSVAKFQDMVNNHPDSILYALLDIQSNCILYSFSSAARLLEMETHQRSFYEIIRHKIADNYTNQMLRDRNGMYILFPNNGRRNFIFVSTERYEQDVNGKVMKKIKVTLSLLLWAETYILITPPKQGKIISSYSGKKVHSSGTKRRKLDDYEFTSTLDYLNQFVKDYTSTAVRHFLYQGLISLKSNFHDTQEPGVISLNYFLDDDGIDHSNCRIYIRTTEPTSWSAEIRCAYPSIFPSVKDVRDERFETVHNKDKRMKIDIVTRESEDDSPAGHSIFLHYSVTNDSINSFYSDFRMLHVMGFLARQLDDLKSKQHLFPNMNFKVRKCHYSGIIIEYSPKTLPGYPSKSYFARIRFERFSYLRIMLSPSHEMYTFIEHDLKKYQDMSRFLRLLECVSIPMIQTHEYLTEPHDHWIIIPRNLGQSRIEYRKRGIVYEFLFSKDRCSVKEVIENPGSQTSDIDFLPFEDSQPPNETYKIITRMSEHAQSKYISLYIQKRLSEESSRCEFKNGVLRVEKDNMRMMFQVDPQSCRINFTVDCPNEILSDREKSGFIQTFQQIYDRSEFYDFRSALNAFCILIIVPFTHLKTLMEHVQYFSDSSGQNCCNLLLQVPSTLSLPPQLGLGLRQTNARKNKYTYESALYLEKNQLHMLFRFTNPMDTSDYVDIPLALNIDTDVVTFEFFDITTDKNIGSSILAKSLENATHKSKQLSQVIKICCRTSIVELRKLL